MAQTDPTRIAAHIAGSVDLYAALRQAGADAGQELILAEIIAALLKGHTVAQATATRLASVDRGFLRAILRKGAGLPATVAGPSVRAYLETISPAPLFLPPIGESETLALLTAGQHPDMPPFSDRAFDAWFAQQAGGVCFTVLAVIWKNGQSTPRRNLQTLPARNGGLCTLELTFLPLREPRFTPHLQGGFCI